MPRAAIVVTNPNTPVKLAPGQSVLSTTAKVLVAALPAGTYKFELEVVDNLGATSLAAIKVQVKPLG
jgi:hypothetical protein